MDIPLFSGIIGMVILLGAFALNLFNKVSHNSKEYNIMNFIGCIFLGYYAISLRSFPFIVINVVWGFFAVYKFIGIEAGESKIIASYNKTPYNKRAGKRKKRRLH